MLNHQVARALKRRENVGLKNKRFNKKIKSLATLLNSLTTLLNSLVTLQGVSKKRQPLNIQSILFVFKHKRFYAPVNLKCLLTVQL